MNDLLVFADSLRVCSVGLAYEMMNSARSPWKPLICNFPCAYDNFLQMQSLEELERATAEVGAVNPGWNATQVVEHEINASSRSIYSIVAAVVALFPSIFPTGLPAKYVMHARMAFLSRAWGIQRNGLKETVMAPVADLFNHQEPAGAYVVHRYKSMDKKELEASEIVMNVSLSSGAEIVYCM